MNAETLDVTDLDTQLLTMRKPKTDKDHPSTSFAKVRFSADQLRLHVYVYDAQLLKRKYTSGASVLYFKATPEIQRSIAAIDDKFVQDIVDHRNEFFSNAKNVEENTLEDFYTRSIIVNATGNVIKMRLKDDAGDDKDTQSFNGRYSLMLYLRGIRFHKSCCYPEWELLKCQKAQPPFLKLDDIGDDNPTDCVSDEEINPTPDQLADITKNLMKSALHTKSSYESRVAMLDDCVRQLESGIPSKEFYKNLNTIADKLENLD